MDFNDTPEEARFREEAASWLAENAPTDETFRALTPLQQAKVWQKRKYDAGWACLGWAPEFGGRGASAIEEVIWRQEESQYDLPANFFLIGQGMIGPTLMAWGSDEDKARFLPPLASGEEVWCQLFSEPAGGSDLAALRTRAEPDGDSWVINGQKIWTSGAHYSDYGVIVVRTDPTVPKHKGLSYFYVDMKAPGVEIKPIKQLTGDSDFNEVYFTDVRVSDSQRLGEVGQGWQVSLTTLMNERAAIGGGFGQMDVSLAMSVAEEVEIDGRPALEDSAVRARIANWYVQEAGLKYTGYRSLTALSRGALPGPENSIGKLVGAPKMQAMSSYLMDLLGASGAIADESLAAKAGIIQRAYMGAPGLRIAGGTDEIMANIIAERVLGLPQEPRLDKGIPFNEVPTG
ncbi:MAG: Putative acyl-CoA dehydrogenase FadE17 [Halieaceae bacterium]|jgi:alkylation response protein AidB-like acyl-CoA dehydrogenase|nr:MAG: Putative acyl-CoA dehydrogenase FadE17 [Halieaceae bacterium]|tara:strand:+ start:27 stop:1232 length:1206 start_codon:yes stop_codon:yes gene_type:complete